MSKPADDDVDTKLVFAFVTVASLGTPISKTLPSAKTKSIESDDANVLENVRVEPETVYELPAFGLNHLVIQVNDLHFLVQKLLNLMLRNSLL